MINKIKFSKLVEQRGLKMSFLIEKSGYSKRHFYNILNGDNEAPDDFLLNVANALHISINQLR